MIQFRPLAISQKAVYDEILALAVHRGCEYNFTNLYLWGQQRYAMVDGFMVIFSQFGEKSVYPFPVGKGDPKAALDAIRQDAADRGIVCALTCMSAEDCVEDLMELRHHVHPYYTTGNLEYLYRSYHALGGNGTGTELYNRAKALPIKND